ncbi:MAG TPA: alpha/beta hydrolase, partial [Nitrososphaeraceae archaeon]|nr:alpha/beta hydrolase [Nitrososphaeraceae archaeon]
MINILRSISVVIGLFTSILFLSYLLTVNLQPSLYFVEAQNSSAGGPQINSKIFIPTTISEQAQKILKNLTMNIPSFSIPDPNDLQGWTKLNQQLESMDIFGPQSVIDSYQSNVTYTKLGGVDVIDVKPQDWEDNGKVLVYLHGGGYTFLSANSTLAAVMPVANLTGLRVISVDYTLAPFSKWNQTTTEVVSVIQALINEKGYLLDDIAIYGDSAGGGLVAGSVLKMRDEEVGIPAAIVLWSPWTDVTVSGDSYYRLNATDPLQPPTLLLKSMASAYANDSEQKNPYVSPVYGNFSKRFPPTLIQGGTSESMLSDFVRLYQALDQADIPVKLDIYEGMPHDFQIFLYNTPESNTALSKMNDFLRQYLRY